MQFLEEVEEDIKEFDAFAARGGILPPLSSGTYLVNAEMVDYLENKSKVEHASNLAAVIAYDLACECDKKAFITDPVSVDEFDDLSRLSGFRDIERRSLLHALNMKAVGRKIADEIGKKL